MTTDKKPLIYAKLTYKIRGLIFKIYNELGFGHKESVYEKAFAHELKINNIQFESEKSLPVSYNGTLVGRYRPDFVIDGKILVELKAVPFLTKAHETQLLYYIRSTNFKLGLLVNFGSEKLEIRRRIWTYTRKPDSIRENLS